MRFRFVATAIALVAGMVLSMTSIAVAAAPPSAPMEIKKLDFEAAQPNGGFDNVLAPLVPSEPTNAVWGRVTGGPAHGGTYSFWCAGRTYPGWAASTFWPTYQQYTRSTAEVNIADLSSYYSARADYYYRYPTRGAGDENSFILYWADAGGSWYAYDNAVPLAASWTKRSLVLPDSLWHQPATFGMRFFDTIEGASEGAQTGAGPAVDDLVISGYKYGPVRDLDAVYSTVPTSNVELTWTKPEARKGYGAADSRAVSYRVWRSLKDQNDYTELTSSDARLASPSYTDTTTFPGRSYDYVVQTWDQGSGTGYGERASVVGMDGRALPSAATLSGPNVPATIYSWAGFTVTGVLNPRHTAGTDIVKIETEQSVSGAWVPKSSYWLKATDYPAGGSKYSGAVSMPSPGTWRIRAVHPDDDPLDHTAVTTNWKTVTVTSKVYLTTPVAPSTMYKTKYYSVYGYLKPRHTAGSKPIRIEAYRYSGSRILTTKVFYATAYNYTSGGSTYTKYKASIRLPYAGRWKIRAYHPSHTGQAATRSGFDYATVK